jgi:hypothetical protein
VNKTAQTLGESVDVSINLADLTAPGDLDFGLFGGAASASGVSSVSLNVSGKGVNFKSETFNGGAAATAGFLDNPFDLGALGRTGTLDLNITLSVNTAEANSYFYGGFILGVGPSRAGALHEPGMALWSDALVHNTPAAPSPSEGPHWG